MKTDQLTFNDLPAVVGELCDRIASMENLLTEKLSKQHEAKENTHVPMTVQEACAYLKMPLSTESGSANFRGRERSHACFPSP